MLKLALFFQPTNGKERNHNTVNGRNTLEAWEANKSLKYRDYRENWWNSSIFEHGEVPPHLDIEATSNVI